MIWRPRETRGELGSTVKGHQIYWNYIEGRFDDFAMQSKVLVFVFRPDALDRCDATAGLNPREGHDGCDRLHPDRV